MSAPTPLFDQAVARHRAGDLAAAEQLYLETLAEDPQDFRAAYNAGVLMLRSGRADHALPLLAFVVQRDGSRPQNWLAYVEALATTGQSDAALQVIHRLRGMGLTGQRLDALEAQASVRKAAELDGAAAEPKATS